MRLIDADAAIEALNTQAEEMSHWSERYQEQRRGVLTAVNIVADCPSVQPNHCAEVGKKVLIDRQEALEAIGTLQTYKLFAGDDMLLIDQAGAQTELMMLPSAQPEHKTGRWIYGESEVGNDGYYCSECGNFVPWIYEESAMNFIREYKFCPNCGAKMDGERKE